MTAKPKDMFEVIKKQNGECFAQAIRVFDNGLFEIKDLDKIVKYAGRNGEIVLEYLSSLKNIKIEEHGVYQDPFFLLDKAGYNAYYADTLEKQDAIKPYFAPKEELCTFCDPTRYEKYYIINAVKKNVDKIKRKNFKNPKREDAYGTSVISIQIFKKGGFISIKNRYNHTVPSSDNTFNSNPDKIIPGLAESLKHYFQTDFSSKSVNLPPFFTLFKNQLIKYNYEIGNAYFGQDFYLKDGEIHQIDKNSEIMMDYFVLNLKEKTIKNLAENLTLENDSFTEVFSREIKEKKLRIIKKQNGNKCILADDTQLAEIEEGKIIALNLADTTHIGNRFLFWNTVLKHFSAKNLKEIANQFLYRNTGLKALELSELRSTGLDFLHNNTALSTFIAPQLKFIGEDFLYNNQSVINLNFPQLQSTSLNFLHSNNSLVCLYAPQLTQAADRFLPKNVTLKIFHAPKLENKNEDLLPQHPHRKKLLKTQSHPINLLLHALKRGGR